MWANKNMLKNYLALALGLILAVWVAYSSGLIVGAKRQKAADSAQYLADLTIAIAENEKRVAKIESDFSQKLNETLSNYEKENKQIKLAADSTMLELGRLRAKSCGASVPKTKPTAPSPGNNDTPGATGGEQPGEVNLDGVARKIIELGEQLDLQNQKLIYLQQYANSCQNAFRL